MLVRNSWLLTEDRARWGGPLRWGMALALVLGWSCAWAQAPAAPIARIKLTDNELTCAQTHAEIEQMDKIVADAMAAEDKDKTTGTTAGAASTVAERCSGCMVDSAPLPILPIERGVRTASMI